MNSDYDPLANVQAAGPPGQDTEKWFKGEK